MTDPSAPYGRKRDGAPKKMPITHPDHPLYKPAGHFPGAGSKPAGGNGWGGAAKGAGKPAFTPETGSEAITLALDKEYMRARLADKARLAEDMMIVYVDVAENSDQPSARVAGATAALNRLIGPVEQKTKIDGTISLESLILRSFGVIEASPDAEGGV